MESPSDSAFKPCFPFTAIEGQHDAKMALILAAIDPSIGGVLISGPKGSGKSLLVRAFAQVLPEIVYVKDCVFRCSPTDPTNMCSDCLQRTKLGQGLAHSERQMQIVCVPLSITDDMLVGSLDMDRALESGVAVLKPGLLAEANQNILYIDEVNLLPDHITDSILDAAASGWNVVEREGISVQHPSRFILIGTMNPEEGELRPQILDRFGIYAETYTLTEPSERARMMQKNEDFAKNPIEYSREHQVQVDELRDRIQKAKQRLPHVVVGDSIHRLIASTCSNLRVDGFRPDIVTAKSAKALAAFNNRNSVTMEYVKTSLQLSLSHRTRESGLTAPPSQTEIGKALRKAERSEVKLELGGTSLQISRVLVASKQVFEALRKTWLRNLVVEGFLLLSIAVCATYLIDRLRTTAIPVQTTYPIIVTEAILGILLACMTALVLRAGRKKEEISVASLDLSKMVLNVEGRLLPQKDTGLGQTGASAGEVKYGEKFGTAPSFGPKILHSVPFLGSSPEIGQSQQKVRSRAANGYREGRRTRSTSSTLRGRTAWHRLPTGRPRDIALVPTLRAASVMQKTRPRREPHPALVIRRQDVREKVREYRPPSSTVLLIDMSMSMIGSVPNLVRGIYSLHNSVLRKRDRVGLVVFKGSKAFVIQHPTTNLDLVIKKLREMGASDFTPLASGLHESWKVLKQEKMRNRDSVRNLIVISDGITNVPLQRPISVLTRRKYHSESQADALDVALLLSKDKTNVYVINTNHSPQEASMLPSRDPGLRVGLTPTQFLMQLARASKGQYQGLQLTGEE